MPLQILTTDTSYEFTGDTFNFRDLIKTLPGSRWNPATRTWSAPLTSDLTAIRARMAEHAASIAAWAAAAAKTAYRHELRREEWTKEQWHSYLADTRKRGNSGPCCSHAKTFTQYDYQGPTCYDCPRHGKTYNSYCGD
jgi:hypothetical protein